MVYKSPWSDSSKSETKERDASIKEQARHLLSTKKRHKYLPYRMGLGSDIYPYRSKRVINQSISYVYDEQTAKKLCQYLLGITLDYFTYYKLTWKLTFKPLCNIHFQQPEITTRNLKRRNQFNTQQHFFIPPQKTHRWIQINHFQKLNSIAL